MFQTHCYDAWLGGNARNTGFLKASQLLGTLPAPIFLFLAGVSFALVMDKLVRKNIPSKQIIRTMFRRGAEIFGFGLLFRLQEFLIAWGWAPWSDLLRVDVLNIIGLSMMLMALVCGGVVTVCEQRHKSSDVSDQPKTSDSAYALYQGMPSGIPKVSENRSGFTRRGFGLFAASVIMVALFALLTPPLYTNWRPTWLPWPIESYIDGCHNLGSPQPWLFPLFPWAAFAFAGLAAGLILFNDGLLGNPAPNLPTRGQYSRKLALFALVGIAAIAAARQFDQSSFRLYATYDYWHTSPNFLMTRVGLLLVIAFLSYAWCEWGLATFGFSPLIQLGQTSLLVYWVHIEFVYGRFSLLPKRAESVAGATRGLLEITLFMLLLSLIRTRIDWRNFDWKKLTLWRKTSGRVQPA
jgi:hypothetical protein